MNCSGSWAIYGSRLMYLQGTGHEAVCVIPRMDCAAVDALRSARPKGENWRLEIKKQPKWQSMSVTAKTRLPL